MPHVDEYPRGGSADPGLRHQARDSFLKDHGGLRGVPQNSIYEINHADFEAIAAATGIEDLLPGE